VVGGMPYSQHFLDRGNALGKPLKKGDVQGAVAAASQDKYLIAPGNDAAKQTHDRNTLRESARFGSRILRTRGEAGVAQTARDCHTYTSARRRHRYPGRSCHAGAIEAGIPRARRAVVKDVGHLMYVEKPAEFSRLVIGFIEQKQEWRAVA
jgi:pimeloyl-ACP methyl ester carboxylesterase